MEVRKTKFSRWSMINKEIFCERMTGLISYYRGAREEFMPRVESDEIVYVDITASMIFDKKNNFPNKR